MQAPVPVLPLLVNGREQLLMVCAEHCAAAQVLLEGDQAPLEQEKLQAPVYPLAQLPLLLPLETPVKTQLDVVVPLQEAPPADASVAYQFVPLQNVIGELPVNVPAVVPAQLPKEAPCTGYQLVPLHTCITPPAYCTKPAVAQAAPAEPRYLFCQFAPSQYWRYPPLYCVRPTTEQVAAKTGDAPEKIAKRESRKIIFSTPVVLIPG
jgi:hypothetical protein